ncbi:MAG: EamA family transporter [Dehalococcoidia bacterium]|jgi:drug/metabolite transporter (DMT)-like permease|nr:EamA family transporter [Dehalococcoidia bacterium]MDP7469782.1 EamA family transporter [Dehalococcoidia bacterium]
MDNDLIGIGFSLLAALGFGSGAVLVRPALSHVSLPLGTFISVLSSLLFIGTIAALADVSALLAVSWAALAWLAVLGLLSFGMGRLFYYQGIHRIGVARAAPIVGATPLVAAVLAVLVYQEAVSYFLALGVVSVVVGVVLILREQA